jgi:arylsulfatase A-like enzyme
MNGEKALVDKGVYGHPRIARVPFVVKLPGRKRRGTEVHTPVCLLDLAPTVLEAAGVMPAARLDGLSLWPLLRGRSAGAHFEKRVFLYEACWHVAPNPAVSVQWRKSAEEHYFYTYNLTSDCDELYDLSDPTYRNLAADRRYQGVKHDMVLRLAHFLQADPRWRCYWHTMRIAKAEHLPLEPGDYQMFHPE